MDWAKHSYLIAYFRVSMDLIFHFERLIISASHVCLDFYIYLAKSHHEISILAILSYQICPYFIVLEYLLFLGLFIL